MPGQLAPKNAVSAWGIPVDWAKFDELMMRSQALAELSVAHGLSTGYLYSLLRYTDMASDPTRPENALWHSHFRYSTRRLLERTIKNDGDREQTEQRRRRAQTGLAREIAQNGIRAHLGAYKIALFSHLYQQRN